MQEISVFIQHHALLSLAFFVVLLAVTVLEFIHKKNTAIKVSPGEVTQLLNRHQAALVDVRKPDAFSAGHIIGSLSIPAQDVSEQNKKISKLKAKPLILVCNHGNESLRLADRLRKQGFDSRVLAGGIAAWNKAHLPLVKE